MKLSIDISRRTKLPTPDDKTLIHWLVTAYRSVSTVSAATELCISIVEKSEMRTLNQRYRKRSNATNVLSFPTELPAGPQPIPLGDIVVCGETVREETAAKPGLTLEAHWAHILVHGLLHLMGYDHQGDAEAEIMEELEDRIMQDLNYPAPNRSILLTAE